MIYTLTLNPAVDRTVYTDTLSKIDVTRVKKTIRDAAGKGINTSKVLKQLSTSSICLGFIAGNNGQFIKNSLKGLNINESFITVTGETRENIKLIEEANNQIYEINEAGPSIDEDALNSLYKQLENLEKEDILILSGSAPKGINKTIYKDIINNYPEIFTILDASGELFKEGIKSKPTVIKPNKFELEQYAGRKLDSIKDIIDVSKELLSTGIKYIFVSLGAEGALLVSNDKTLIATVPSLKIKSTVGAGDSFVAGLSKSFQENKKIEDILTYAASVGSASVLSEGTADVSLSDIDKLLTQINIKTIWGELWKLEQLDYMEKKVCH